MLQFSFSTNGFVVKPEWKCDEIPPFTYLRDGTIYTMVSMSEVIPKRDSLRATLHRFNNLTKEHKQNLWVYKNKNDHTYVMVFKDYHKRDNGTYQIPAQTNCIAATTDTVWDIPSDDINPLSINVEYHVE